MARQPGVTLGRGGSDTNNLWKARHYAAFLFIGTPALMAARMLWRGVPRGVEAWTESVQHALMFTVPYLGVQFLIQLVRRRALRHSHINRSDLP